MNAVIHKDYRTGIPIQISVYEHKIVLWNPGQLPERWTLQKLFGKHPSNPFNPLLASAFFRAGYVEAWGRGIEKMYRECVGHDIPAPIFDTSMSGLMVTFEANPAHLVAALGKKSVDALLNSSVSGEVTGEVTEEVTGEVERLLLVLVGDMSRAKLQQTLGLAHEDHFRAAYLTPAIQAGYVAMTIPDKPKSRLQRYRLTPRGKLLRDRIATKRDD